MLRIFLAIILAALMISSAQSQSRRPVRIQQADAPAMTYKQARRACILGTYGRFLKRHEIAGNMFTGVDQCATRKMYGGW